MPADLEERKITGRLFYLEETGTTTIQKDQSIVTSAERVLICCAVSATGNALPPFPRNNFK